MDGDYIDLEQLLIPRERFVSQELRKPLCLPADVASKFDLALSLEVAEHLPQDDAQRFVRTLTGLAPAVLFSAAAPYQGGTDHRNEQWPSYWAELFESEGYVTIDCLRP